MSTAATVFVKELADALRDRRALLIALTISLLSGPLVFVLISNFVSSIESKVAEREVFVAAPEAAPTLINFLQRAGARISEAPCDWQTQLRSGRIQNAVIVPPADFEARLATGETVPVEVWFDQSHDKAAGVVGATIRLVNGFNRELRTQRLIARGVSPQLLSPVEVRERDLATSKSRGAQLLFIVPWAALMVAVFGALSVAIDVTAGERERGSLEPLLINPITAGSIVLGKWLLVMVYSAAIVLLTMAGFMLSMQFISNETLQALMQLRGREIAIFSVVLLPFAGMMAALNMLAASFGRSFKEAQTYVSYIAMAVQFSAVLPAFLTVRDATWQLWVPSVGQLMVLLKALRGEPLGLAELLVPMGLCVVLTALCLWGQTRLLGRESIVYARS